MGFLPILLWTIILIVLFSLFTYNVLRNKKRELEQARAEAKELALARQQLVTALGITLPQHQGLGWHEDLHDFHALLHRQEEQLTWVDDAAVEADLSEGDAAKVAHHLQASQNKLEEMHALYHTYNHLVEQKPFHLIAKTFGFAPA